MADKVYGGRNAVEVESEQIIDNVSAEKGNEGTAMALAQAVEESDETIYGISVRTQDGAKKVTVWCKYGTAGEGAGVPEPLHDQLTEWGYEHAGERTGDYKHTEAWGSHVYTK